MSIFSCGDMSWKSHLRKRFWKNIELNILGKINMRKSHNNLCVSLYKKLSKNNHIYGIVTESFDQFTPAADIKYA